MRMTAASGQQKMIPTRYSLLSRLANWDDQKSWREFFETYWRLIYSLAIKSGLTEVEAQDVVQETVLSVAKQIEKFKRDRTLGSFKGWLHNVVRWRIADQFRKRGPCGRASCGSQSELSTAVLNSIPDTASTSLESLWQEEWQANLFEAAVERVKRSVKEEHYQIFDMYVIKQWPVTKVARIMGVSVGKVYLIKHRISALIKSEIRSLEQGLF